MRKTGKIASKIPTYRCSSRVIVKTSETPCLSAFLTNKGNGVFGNTIAKYLCAAPPPYRPRPHPWRSHQYRRRL
jgi:hypothetical protein